MTYGKLRLRLSKLFPGVDLELIEGWIQDVYTETLDVLPWKRAEAESVIQAPRSYITGTLAATQGSAAIVGTGTAWSPTMDGLMIRIANQAEYYQLTVLSGTTATLDRAYEAASASGLTYRIDQPVFVLPSNCRILRSVVPLHDGLRPLDIVSPGEIDRISTSRNTYGTPRWAAQTWDNFSDPPRMQLELYPVPDCPNSAGAVLSWGITYIFDAAEFNPNTTSTTLLPWVRPSILIEGVSAKVQRHLKDFNAADRHKAEFDSLLHTAAHNNALQRGPQTIRLAPELRRQKPGRYQRGPWHRGFTG